MKKLRFSTVLTLALGVACGLGSGTATPDDIDIFTSGSGAAPENPNVLIIIDNTSNWARQSQQWPEKDSSGQSLQQGQSEVRAISTALGSVDSSINIGMMEFVTAGTANNTGGFVRQNVVPMNTTNKSAFQAKLATIFNNINDPVEKRNANTQYGDLMFDAYNYFAGFNHTSGSGNSDGSDTIASAYTPATLIADPTAYTVPFQTFQSPLSASKNCAHTFIIFIANPNSSGPANDTAYNDSQLAGLPAPTIARDLPRPDVTTKYLTKLGYTSQCYTSQAACSTSDFGSSCQAAKNGCFCDSTDTITALPACINGLRYNVLGTNTTTQNSTTNPTGTSSCYKDQTTCNAAGNFAGATLTCPANTDTGSGTNPRTVTTYSCSYGCASSGSVNSCAVIPATPPTSRVAASPATGTATSSATTSACYTTVGNFNSANDHAGLTCPTSPVYSPASCTTFPCTQNETDHSCTYSAAAGTACSVVTTKHVVALSQGTYSSVANANTKINSNCTISGSADNGTPACPANTAGVTYSCTCAAAVSNSDTTFSTTNVPFYNNPDAGASPVTTTGTWSTGGGGQGKFPIVNTETITTSGNKYDVTQTDNQTFWVDTNNAQSTYNFGVTETINKSVATTSTTTLGNTYACYTSAATASTSDYSSQCSAFTGGCAIDATSGGTTGVCPTGARYAVQAVPELPEVVAVNPAHYSTPSASTDFNADEWAKYMHTKGIPVGTSPNTSYQTVSTYTIDVYYQSPDPPTTSLLMNMAGTSGGKYYAAHSEQQIVDALKQILTEIQAVNSAFASASLPVNATNRAQDKNQVFIGMFRPSKDATPKWFGNLKQYQLILGTSGNVDLGDVNGKSAVSSTTGFVNDCAIAFWTSDSGTYWTFSQNGPNNLSNDPAKTGCKTSSNDPFSDSPDGPLVEKGAAAEVVRKGNTPPTTDTTPTYLVNRNLKTLPTVTDPGPFVTFNSTNVTTLSSTLVDFISGKDTQDEDQDGNVTKTRPSIHGDVVHSRPQPVDFAGTIGVVVFYGSNDGMLHAVQATNGQELWAFVPPEFFSRFLRLQDNCPLILYPSSVSPPNCTAPSDLSSKPPIAKDYFFDGSVGLYESQTTPPVVWIYPSMRRGGRMIYALDVSTATSPVYKWKFGCPSLTNDSNCTTHTGDVTPASGAPDVTGIGQTWSTPDVTFIKGYDPTPGTPNPVIVLGGGSDGCEDVDTASPSCGSAKGHGVYVLDAFTGVLLASFPTDRSVTADMALLDIDFDGKADFAYVADTGGSIYRINFINPATRAVLDKTQWTITKVAHTTGSGRKFQFQPALVQASGTTIYIALGTGDREHPLICQYPFPTAQAGTNTCKTGVNNTGVTNRFYVFKDYLTSLTATDFNLDDTDPTVMANRAGNPGCGTTPILPGDGIRGWYKDLNVFGPGEQTVTSAVVAGGLVFFSTNRPIPPAAQSCSNTLGDAKGYKVNLLTGGGALNSGGVCGGSLAASFLGGGLPPSPVMATVPIGSSVKTVIIGAVQDDPSGGGIQSEIGAQETKPNIASKRRPVYWKKSGAD